MRAGIMLIVFYLGKFFYAKPEFVFQKRVRFFPFGNNRIRI